MPSDSELLLRYAQTGDEAAFAALVQGHIALVYSAALRRVGGDPHAASEITQGVFTALARNAAHLASHPVLNAWLHASTRNAAANLRRSEDRRERRLQEIQLMQELQSSERVAQEWQSIRGVLDESLDELSESDRRAIILRFFENRSYPLIGDIMGLQQEAARMRVARALEKLRTRLARRGIASTAALLSTALSANSVVSVPPGLAAATAATASAVTAAIPVAGIIQFMTITKLSGTLVVLAIVAGLSTIAYRSSSVPDEMPEKQGTLTAPVKPAVGEKTNPPLAVGSVEPPPQNELGLSPLRTTEAENKIMALRELFALFPEQSIPELKLATDADWHAAVEGRLETPDDYKRAMANIRSRAQSRFAKLVQPAIRAFMSANNQQFPTDTAQLLGFIGEPLDAAMLGRYRIAPASEIPNVRIGGDMMITQNNLIDPEYDSHSIIGSSGLGSASSLKSSSSRALETLRPVNDAYRSATGAAWKDVSDLLPYATTPEQLSAIEILKKKILESGSGGVGGASR